MLLCPFSQRKGWLGFPRFYSTDKQLMIRSDTHAFFASSTAASTTLAPKPSVRIIATTGSPMDCRQKLRMSEIFITLRTGVLHRVNANTD